MVEWLSVALFQGAEPRSMVFSSWVEIPVCMYYVFERLLVHTFQENRHCPRKRLAFPRAKFEPASTLARSDWQARNTEQCAIAHSSEALRKRRPHIISSLQARATRVLEAEPAFCSRVSIGYCARLRSRATMEHNRDNHIPALKLIIQPRVHEISEIMPRQRDAL